MKKIILFALALIIAASMIGCSKDGGDVADTSNAVSENTTAQTAADSTNAKDETTSTKEEPSATAVSVHTENYMHGECHVTIMYPRYGDGEHDAFDVAMRNHAVQEFNMMGMMPEDSAVYEIISCDIKYESEYFVSAVVCGTTINPTYAHDTHFAYTVNADPRNGKVYSSEELIGDVEAIKSAFAEDKATQSYGIDGLMKAIDDGTITYENDITVSWRSDYGVFPDLYFTGHSLGVMAELSFVMGGYAGFEIPYAEAGDMINPTAKGLCGIIVTTE